MKTMFRGVELHGVRPPSDKTPAHAVALAQELHREYGSGAVTKAEWDVNDGLLLHLEGAPGGLTGMHFKHFTDDSAGDDCIEVIKMFGIDPMANTVMQMSRSLLDPHKNPEFNADYAVFYKSLDRISVAG